MQNTVLLSDYARKKTLSFITMLSSGTYSAWVNSREHMLEVFNQTPERVAETCQPTEYNLPNP